MSSETSNAQTTTNGGTTSNSSSVPIPAWCHQCQKQIRVNPNCDVYTCNDCEGDFVEIIEQPNAPDDPSVFTPPILPGILRAIAARSGDSGTEETSRPTRMHTRSQAGRSPHRVNTLSSIIASRRNAEQADESDGSTSEEDMEDTSAPPAGSTAGGVTSSANVANISGSRATDSSRQQGSLRLRLRDALRRVERIRTQGDHNSNSLDSFFEDMLMMMAQGRGSRVAYVGDDASEEGRRHMRIGDYVIGDMDEIVNELMQQHPGGAPAHSTSNEVLNKLPCLNHSIASASPHKGQNEQCAVCREEFPWSPSNENENNQTEDTPMDNGEDAVWALPCAHWFHRECCEQWLKEHNTCPVCRNELPTTDEEYNESKNLSMQAFDRWREAFLEGHSTRAEEAAQKVCTASAAT
eukprot:gb/GECG01005534.1/.p1 GENE.gb/GECG01005534.1/~~gb/GECG01005534.1/.p1  ORF type:complete len:408 (+),score=68.88 gb/GECG01005534.1/:1-1224(+)